jgi:hypothetical protein
VHVEWQQSNLNQTPTPTPAQSGGPVHENNEKEKNNFSNAELKYRHTFPLGLQSKLVDRQTANY